MLAAVGFGNFQIQPLFGLSQSVFNLVPVPHEPQSVQGTALGHGSTPHPANSARKHQSRASYAAL
jgi:hypothetical protein